MRVALVTYGFLIGGVEKFLLMLGEGLRSHGMQVTYVVAECIGAWHERPKNEGFEVVTVLPSLWQSPRRHALRLAPALAGFDAVLVNHCPAAQAIIGELPASCLVVTILHNDQEMVYRIGLSNLHNTDYVVGVGSKILSVAARRGAPQTKLVYIPYGVDVPAVYPKDQRPLGGRPLKIVFVGRIFHEQKGVLDIPLILLEALRLGADITFEFVGDGEPDLTTLRQEFAARLPKLPVVFHGRKDNVEALRLLSQADILLMPSRFEGLPVALLEALAQAVVPIASRLPGVTDDAVCEDVNGFLPPVGDIDGFARAIVRLQDDDTRLRMSHAAWERARSEFTKEIMVGRYLELLRRPGRRSKQVESLDQVGRALFRRSWFLPMGLVDAAKSIRAWQSSYRQTSSSWEGKQRR